MRREVKLLYDVMADTIGYIQVKMRAASLELARIHAWSMHCARFACDEIINSLRFGLLEEKPNVSSGAISKEEGRKNWMYTVCNFLVCFRDRFLIQLVPVSVKFLQATWP